MRSLSSASSTSMRLAFDRVAAFQFRCLDRLGAIDLEPAGLLLGADALGGNRLFLRNAGRFDGFARSNLDFLYRPVARDLERANVLFLGDP